ncbi:PAS domain S-box-containing protein [Actinoplanes campanulatus]|uniref:histidine kinase n=1 Tax=Actinoplanes campanulatus TaxID=113559 RepID=A0A7W5ACS7_9ACTN|nr:PAS domain S-box protein [Actinoplanes campanulatus]MBB3093828.1 PAS domain S-box-containing protein [Actinoplanes campanulatus]GGN05953.1 hybrid sensor histidine kinase/response regulator [Actinoplanes campanulatus]GID35095.1 hybrid sensor histidine kinase/response regulator [Actinoplanes campanulatus]
MLGGAASLVAAGAVTAGVLTLAARRLRHRLDRYHYLAEILNQTGTPAFVKGLTGRYRLTSVAYDRLQDIPNGGATGRYDREVHPPIRLGEFRRRDRAALAADGPVAFEDMIPDAGRMRRFVTTLYALRDHHDRPYAIFGVSAEVTDLTVSEAGRLTQAHENAQLAAIVEASQDAIVSKFPDGTIKTWNPGAERLYGYTAEEMIGSDMTRLLPPDRLGEERDLLARVLGGQALTRFETRRRRKDGAVIEVSLSMAPMRDADGAVIGASTVAHDITARVLAEHRRRVEREQLEMIMQAASDPFFTMDAAGEITEWNRQAEHVFGWRREEILGRDLTGTILPERYHAALLRLLDGRLEWLLDRPTEMAARHRDGHEIPVELTMWCIRHDHSPHYHGFVRDITARRQTEQALAEARDQAIEAARLKSQFLASMSHEIRTPMNGVIGLTSLLLGSPLDDRQRRYAEGIGAAGSALLAVINDILDFSKLEAGKVLLEDANFPVARLIAEVVALVAPPDTQKAVTVRGDCDPELPATVCGDPGKLRQVLLNLAGNAVKFTPSGRVVVAAALDRTVTAGPDAVPIRFEVRDTGIGIEALERERLFEAFTQADASTTRRFGGTGLGLAISRDLVELMGGRIGVESVPGEGSTFWFSVTLRTAREGLDLFGRHRLDGLRVLIVDPDDDDRTVLMQQLGAWSMDATGARDEDAATRALTEAATAGRPFDLVITDVESTPVERLVPAGCPVPKTVLLAADPGHLPGEPDQRVSGAFAKPLRQAQLFDALAGVLSEADGDGVVGTVAANPPGRGHLLLVEDNEINRTVALGILANLGYTADVAVNGREAVERALSRDYQAVFMDCLMPEMDGYQATAEIRRREPPGRHVPIIALTASALAEDRARCLAAGMDEHLPKPLIPADVARVLEHWSPAAPPDLAEVTAEIERRLDHLRGPDPAATAGALTGLLATLSAKIPEHLDRIEQALAFDDAGAIRTEAHQLMGVLANLGAGPATTACGRIESAARAGDLDAAVAAFTAARPLIRTVREAADQIRRRPVRAGGGPR